LISGARDVSLLGFSCKAAVQAQVSIPVRQNQSAGNGGAEVSESQANQVSTEVLVAH